MVHLVMAVALLVLGHVVPSAPGVRAKLIARLGRPVFLGLYSVVSLVLLGVVVVAYRAADPGVFWYLRPAYGPHFAVALMPIAVLLVVGRLTTRPGAHPVGIYRLCAVPGSAGVLLWAGLHLVNLGAARQVILFVGMAAIALVALQKNLGRAPPSLRRVGVLPGLALITGRERLAFAEIGLGRIAASILIYALLLWLHPLVLGPDPLAAAS